MELTIVLGVAAYLLPTIIAFIRGHNSKWGIMLLNLFLGVTGIFWFISLVWSVSATGAQNQNIVVNNNQQVGK